MATTSRFVAKNGLDNNSKTLLNIGTSGSELSFSGGHLVTFTSTGTTTLTLPTTGTLATTGDIKDATLTLGVSGVGLSGSANFSANTSSNATFTVTSNATSANTVSTIVSRDTSGNFSAGTITASLDGNATNVTGTVAIVNGGTGATSATSAITNLGATTVGANLFKLTDPSATTFIRINSANTVSTRTAAEFRSDLGATTVGSALFTLSNPGSTSFIRINADNTVTAQSASSYRTDLGANTVGSNIFTLTNPSATTFIKINADNTVTARSASEMRTDLGATSLGSDFFTLSTSSTSYIQITSTGSINLLNASNFRTAIGAGTGTVTSVDLSMPSIFSVSNNPVTTSGTLTVSLANQTANTVFAGPSTGSSAAPTFRTLTFADVTDTLTVGKGGTGTSSLTSNSVLVGNGTSSVTLTSTSTQYKVFVSGSGGAPTWGSVSLDQAAAISGKLPLEHGGTNATTAAEALTNLGALSSSTSSTQDGYFGNIYLQDDTSPSNYLQITNFDNLTASRTLKINCNDADKSLTISADSTISGTNTGDQTITLTGDVTGSGTSSFAATLATSGVTSGTYNNSTTAITPFTVDSKGRITSTSTNVTITPAFSSLTSKPTTLSGYGITDALSNSTSSTQSGYFGELYLYDTSTPSNYLKILNVADLTATRTLSINTGNSNRTLTLDGDSTISGTNTGDQTITLTGDVTGSGTSSFAATLATSGVTAGTYNNSTTAITPFTVDSKGRITSTGVASTISPAFSSITSKPTTLSGYGITDALSNSTSSTQNAYFGNIHLQDDTTPSHYLQITDAENLTADRILSLNVNDANRTISLSGNLTVSTSATISGTNTGDQTITLTGDVTGSGTSSFSATIGSQAVTFAKIVNSGTTGLSVVGRSANSAGSFDEISAGSDGQILRRSGNTIAFGNINLSSSNAVGTTILNVNNGGIGTSTASANNVFAGPTTGSATTPAFRALVAADIPSLNYAPQTTGTSLLYGNNAGGFSNATVSTGLSFSGGTLSNTGVTSVGLSLPNIFTVSTSTVTTTGTLTATLSTTSANNVFAGPTTGSATTPAFRALVAADIPNLDANKITTGTIATARLASGTAASTSYLRGDQTWATITATSPAGGSGSLQYNNAGSFGGAAYARWNSTNNSLWLYAAPTATTLSAVLQMGAGFTDEVPAIGDFAGSANGTILASNIGTSFTGNQVDFQVAGSNIFKIDSSGNTTIAATTQSTSTTSGALKVSGGVGIVKNVYVGGNIQVGSGTFTRASTNDIILDNSSTSDTPGVTYYYGNNTNMGTDVFSSGGTARFRIVKNLNETGGAELWSVNVNGIVTRTAWAVGETIKTQTYIWSDMSMSSVSDPTSVTSSSYTTIATASYTPLSSSSYLWIEFSATYDYLNGTSADEFAANIEVGGTEIINVFQKFINGSGGGGRSGVLFPLSGRYTNAGTSSLTITVRVKRNSGDDPIRVFGNAGSGLMRIQEIGR